MTQKCVHMKKGWFITNKAHISIRKRHEAGWMLVGGAERKIRNIIQPKLFIAIEIWILTRVSNDNTLK